MFLRTTFPTKILTNFPQELIIITLWLLYIYLMLAVVFPSYFSLQHSHDKKQIKQLCLRFILYVLTVTLAANLFVQRHSYVAHMVSCHIQFTLITLHNGYSVALTRQLLIINLISSFIFNDVRFSIIAFSRSLNRGWYVTRNVTPVASSALFICSSENLTFFVSFSVSFFGYFIMKPRFHLRHVILKDIFFKI